MDYYLITVIYYYFYVNDQFVHIKVPFLTVQVPIMPLILKTSISQSFFFIVTATANLCKLWNRWCCRQIRRQPIKSLRSECLTPFLEDASSSFLHGVMEIGTKTPCKTFWVSYITLFSYHNIIIFFLLVFNLFSSRYNQPMQIDGTGRGGPK